MSTNSFTDFPARCPHFFTAGNKKRGAWVEVEHGKYRMCLRCGWHELNRDKKPWPSAWEIFIFKLVVKWLDRHQFLSANSEIKRRILQ